MTYRFGSREGDPREGVTVDDQRCPLTHQRLHLRPKGGKVTFKHMILIIIFTLRVDFLGAVKCLGVKRPLTYYKNVCFRAKNQHKYFKSVISGYQ